MLIQVELYLLQIAASFSYPTRKDVKISSATIYEILLV